MCVKASDAKGNNYQVYEGFNPENQKWPDVRFSCYWNHKAELKYLSNSLNLPSTIAGTFFKGLIAECISKRGKTWECNHYGINVRRENFM